MRELRAGIAQLRPTALDAENTVDRVIDATDRAADDGVTLLAFPETFVPVYPLWCDAGTFGQWKHDPAKTVHAANPLPRRGLGALGLQQSDRRPAGPTRRTCLGGGACRPPRPGR